MSRSQREELARFLRSRRDRIRPEDVGLPAGPRRRLPGLRREELAMLAGVSSTWYTYLEQAREGVHPSRQVLHSLARVLRLGEDEIRHLHRLADEAAASAIDSELSPTELAVQLVRLGETSPYPIYAVNTYCDMVAWNQASTTYYADFARFQPEQQNMIWWLIGTREARERILEWEKDVQDVVARWRRVTALIDDTERLDKQVTEYKRISPQFALWWDSHDVREHHSRLRHFNHPQLGAVTLRVIVVQSIEMAPFSHLVVYHTPVE